MGRIRSGSYGGIRQGISGLLGKDSKGVTELLLKGLIRREGLKRTLLQWLQWFELTLEISELSGKNGLLLESKPLSEASW